MKIYRTIEEIDIRQPTAVTVGTFDGVHKGHQKILNELEKCAIPEECLKVLVTFHPHPKTVVKPELKDQVKLLTSLEEKLYILQQYGLQAVVVIPFTKEFSETSYIDFIRNILVEKLHVNKMVVGHDHAFGRNREGHAEQLKQVADTFNFEVKVVEPFYVEGELVNSTAIREYLNRGNIEQANLLLGHRYFLFGVVEEGSKRGRELGYPTANIKLPQSNKMIPKNGVYAVDVIYKGNRYSGMMNIGHRPTFNFDPLTIEVHIFKFHSFIYGESISIEFKKFIRVEKKFSTSQELKEQMEKDKEICKNL